MLPSDTIKAVHLSLLFVVSISIMMSILTKGKIDSCPDSYIRSRFIGLSEKPRGGVHLHVSLGFANIQSPLLERMTGIEERYWMPESVRVSQFQKE